MKSQLRLGISVDDEVDNGVMKKRKSRKVTKNKKEPIHWTLDSDEPFFHLRLDGATSVSEVRKLPSNTTYDVSLVRFIVRGPPKPLVRHRVSTMRMYNPSAEAQDSFRKLVRQLLLSRVDNVDETANFPPVFPTQSLAMTIAFRMKRPKKHFYANRPGPGRLRATAPPQTSVMRSDVDNLAKFVLDSLNGLMYEDDRQVCSLHVTKFLDNDDYCLGATEVCVRVLDDGDLSNLIDNSFDLF